MNWFQVKLHLGLITSLTTTVLGALGWVSVAQADEGLTTAVVPAASTPPPGVSASELTDSTRATDLLRPVGLVERAPAAVPPLTSAIAPVIAPLSGLETQSDDSAPIVELTPAALTPTTLTLAEPPTGILAAAQMVGNPQTESLQNSETTQSVATANPPLLISQTGERFIRILSPKMGGTIPEPTTTLVVQYPGTAKVQLLVNGKPVDEAVATQANLDSSTNITTQVWYRIPLRSGENRLTVQAEGYTAANLTLNVAETAVKIEFLPMEQRQVQADGRSLITLQGQILDEEKRVVDKDVLVTLTTSAGKFIGADQDKDRNGFQVLARQGKFIVQLQSSIDPQLVRVRAAVDRADLVASGRPPEPPIRPFPQQDLPSGRLAPDPTNPPIEAYTQVEFTTYLRPSLVAGVVNLRLGQAGADFYGSFRDFLNPALIQQGAIFDAKSSLFATGKVGGWLFTGAFRSDRGINEDDCNGSNSLFRNTSSCEQAYAVYGDSSTSTFLTPSRDSLYVKLERTSPVPAAGSDFFMWGSYDTQEFARESQVFTATSRQLHGFKGNYNFGNLQITGIFATGLQGFQRDTIVPNGTSGYYFLSRRLVVGGSEQVFLETEEVERPGTVVERKLLTPGTDYEIDYDRGSLLFRRAILATEFDIFGRSLVRRLVITYQYEGVNLAETSLYGTRLQYNLSREVQRESWIAGSYLFEDQGDRNFKLGGVDFKFSFGRDSTLVGEYATSTNDSIFLNNVTGSAYRLEYRGTLIPNVQARAYFKSVDANFANNATFSFTPGQTRYGAELGARLTPNTRLQVQADREQNYGIAAAVRGITALTRAGFGDLFNPTPEPIPGVFVDNELTTVRVGLSHRWGKADFGVDWLSRSRDDRLIPNRLRQSSDQIITRFSYPLTDKITFRAQDERNFIPGDALYPDRTVLAVDWQAFPGVTLRLGQQFLSGTQLVSNSITSLDTIVDSRLGENTVITARHSLLSGINGFTGQGALGLNHTWKIAPGLRITTGYERIYPGIFPFAGPGRQFAQPLASGQSGAFLGLGEADSYSLGLDYTDNPNFKINGRFEYRNSNDGDNLVVSTAAAGKITPALTMLFRYQQANFANQLLTNSGINDTINVRLGLAYRNPRNDKFNALFRYEYRQNPGVTPDTILIGTGTGSNTHLLALETIFAPNWQWELYGKLAIRSTEAYLARDLLGSNAITLGQLRATRRIGQRFDITGEVRWIGQTVTEFNEVGYAIEGGYYLTPNLRVALGYSFGRASDRDISQRVVDGFYIGLSLKVNELFSGFGVQMPSPPQQRESEVKPVVHRPTPAPPSASQPSSSPASQPMGGTPVSLQPRLILRTALLGWDALRSPFLPAKFLSWVRR